MEEVICFAVIIVLRETRSPHFDIGDFPIRKSKRRSPLAGTIGHGYLLSKGIIQNVDAVATYQSVKSPLQFAKVSSVSKTPIVNTK